MTLTEYWERQKEGGGERRMGGKMERRKDGDQGEAVRGTVGR